MSPSIFFLYFIGLLLILVGLNLKNKHKFLGISLAVLGFIIGTWPVWYGHLIGPSPSEMRQLQIQEYLVPNSN